MKKRLVVAGVVAVAGVFWIAGRTAVEQIGRLRPADPPALTAIALHGLADVTAANGDAGLPPVAAADPLQPPEAVTRLSGYCRLVARQRSSDPYDRIRPAARAAIQAGAPDPSGLPAELRRRLRRERNSMDLFRAAVLGDAGMVRELLRKGANPNIAVAAAPGLTPLAWAAACNQPQAVRALIAGGARVDQRLSFQASPGMKVTGSTALIWASFGNADRGVRALIGAGADPNLRETVNVEGRTAPGRTALDAAVDSDDAVADLLLAAGARPDAADADGVDMLMVEAQTGRLERIWRLLDHGADPTRRDRFGDTAEDHARAFDQREAAEVLARARADREARRANPVERNVGGDPDSVAQSAVHMSVERQAPCAPYLKTRGGRTYPEADHATLAYLRTVGLRGTRYHGKSCIWRVGVLRAEGGARYQIFIDYFAFGASTERGSTSLLVLDGRGRYVGMFGSVDETDVRIEGPDLVVTDDVQPMRFRFTRAGPPRQAYGIYFSGPGEPTTKERVLGSAGA